MMRAQRKGSAQELQECLKQAKTASISFFESAVMHARRQLKQIGLAAVLASLALTTPWRNAQAADPSMLRDDTEQSNTIDINVISSWLRSRFSATELEQLQSGQLRVQVHYCGCSDRPTAHFPYQLVLLETPKGDLVARPEHHEFAVDFTALAVKYGTRYCAVDKPDCYGSFAQPCDFTDFRYGPTLAQFFPTCKTDDADATAMPLRDEQRTRRD